MNTFKSYLKTGDIVEFRNGVRAIFMWGRFMYESTLDAHLDPCIWPGVCSLDSYTRDLKHFIHKEWDVVKVKYNPSFPVGRISHYLDFKENLIIWDRIRPEEVKEVTMDEVEEKFGCKVKIVKEEKE